MTTSPQILGQQKPTALIETVLFTVLDNNTAEFSIFINNQSQAYDGYTIALVPYGQSGPNSSQYLAFESQLSGGGTVAFSGLYLNSGDTVYVTSNLGNCSFTATGIYFSQ
jgi:hypothetical protein